MNKLEYIFILGYGWSGSSALVDLLKEFDGYCEPDTEFRLIKEHYGIMDLEYALVDRWDGIETDLAIKDFLWLAERFNGSSKKYSLNVGLNYENLIGKHFLTKTKEYVEQFIICRFDSFWVYHIWKWSKIEFFFNKVLNKLKIRPYPGIINFSAPVLKMDFENKTRKYMDELFTPISKKYGCSKIILDQGVPAHMPEIAFRYTDKSKVIIVDRDPRDVYVDLINCQALIGQELARKDNAKLFIDWYSAYREGQLDIKKRKDVLFIQFEDLIYRYDETVDIILSFLEENKKLHLYKKKYFDPSQSEKNIGIWKKYASQNVMKEIENYLQDFCYAESK